jgi:hypothetical protein
MKARMAAEVLRLTHNIDEKVQSVMVQVKGVDKGVQGVGVRGVDENVNILKEKVQMVIDGAETVLGKSPTPSLIFNRPDGREAATKVKLVMQQIAYNANDVDRPLSLLSSLAVKHLTLPQGEIYERALENGSLLRIPPQIQLRMQSPTRGNGGVVL